MDKLILKGREQIDVIKQQLAALETAKRKLNGIAGC